MQDGYFLNTEKLDLSMDCMKGVTRLLKLSDFSDSDYTFRANCMYTQVP